MIQHLSKAVPDYKSTTETTKTSLLEVELAHEFENQHQATKKQEDTVSIE